MPKTNIARSSNRFEEEEVIPVHEAPEVEPEAAQEPSGLQEPDIQKDATVLVGEPGPEIVPLHAGQEVPPPPLPPEVPSQGETDDEKRARLEAELKSLGG